MNVIIMEPHALRIADLPKQEDETAKVVGAAIGARIAEEDRVCAMYATVQTYDMEYNDGATTVMRRLAMIDTSEKVRGIVVLGGFMKGRGLADAPSWLVELAQDAVRTPRLRRCA
jgi:hypothetical protein